MATDTLFAPSSKSASGKTIRFRVDKDHFRKIEVEPGIAVYHIYPTLASWVGRAVPDDVNPRSHENVSGNVPQAIENTIRENPQDFFLANRGGTVLAKSLQFDARREVVEIHFDEWSGDEAKEGMADGGTTDAVIAMVQREVVSAFNVTAFDKLPTEKIPEHFQKARYHLEVIVGLNDYKRIERLVEGRNTSKQVRSWTLADWGGNFDWIKEILDQEDSLLKGKVGYEENAGRQITILEILSILTLFHKTYDEKSKAPTVAYSSRGRMDQRLGNAELTEGYKALSPVIFDILKLHDYIYVHFHEAYMKARPKGKLGNRGERDKRIFPNTPRTLALTESQSEFTIPNGILYPLLASFRALLSYDRRGRAQWRTDPYKFFDRCGPELMDNLIEQLEVMGNNPQTIGKAKTVYTALHNQARLLIADQN